MQVEQKNKIKHRREAICFELATVKHTSGWMRCSAWVQSESEKAPGDSKLSKGEVSGVLGAGAMQANGEGSAEGRLQRIASPPSELHILRSH